MQVGIGGEAPVMFETLILQHGGTFYKKDMGATAFDSTEVLNAFKMWTGFYSEYSLSLVYDIYSYFRSGVMPLVIADYTLYTQFAVAAPEIRGLCSMYPFPGLKQSDGSISRRESSTGTGAILMAGAKEEKTGFAFLDWWSRTETQRIMLLNLR
jgi:ABC-type glycerol-3-phosphate transport system substrate-binding protein